MANDKKNGDQNKTKKKELFSRQDKEKLEGSGTPIPYPFRHLIEAKMGKDFSNVRVHSGQNGGRMTSLLGAEAFAAGNHILLAPGKFNPGDPNSQKLLAHELSHIVQQQPGKKNQTGEGQ